MLEGGRVENGRLDHWDFGIRIFTGSGSGQRGISRLSVTNMSVAGMYAMDNNDTITVSRSLFRHDGIGVEVVLGGGYKIDRTTFIDNQGSGVDSTVGSELTVTSSTFSGNGAAGVYSAYGVGPTTITRNVFSNNKADGLTVSSDGPARVGKNVSRHNGGHGLMVSSAGVVDLGGEPGLRQPPPPAVHRRRLQVSCREHERPAVGTTAGPTRLVAEWQRPAVRPRPDRASLLR